MVGREELDGPLENDIEEVRRITFTDQLNVRREALHVRSIQKHIQTGITER